MINNISRDTVLKIKALITEETKEDNLDIILVITNVEKREYHLNATLRPPILDKLISIINKNRNLKV